MNVDGTGPTATGGGDAFLHAREAGRSLPEAAEAGCANAAAALLDPGGQGYRPAHREPPG